MAFSLHRDESVAAGLRRIALELLDDARVRMGGMTEPDKDIHETRKNVKKVRAVLRLGRPGLSETVYQRDNPYLRDFNRGLATLRDAFVKQKLLSAMQSRFKGQLRKKDLTPLQRRLEREHREVIEGFLASSQRRSRVANDLAVVTAAVSSWPEFDRCEQVLAAGLARIYRRGRDEFAIARARPGTHELHDWRKRVKYLWYHVQILSAAWPGTLDAHAKALHELAETLGEDHDIAVFQASVLGDEIELAPMQRKALLDGLMLRRRELARAALGLGGRCYVESPRAFSRRVIGYWRQYNARPWQTEAGGKGIH